MTEAEKLTKKAALHEFRSYMHDVRASAKREGERVVADSYWPTFVERWLEDGKITPEVAGKWIERGPR